ncbi:MAG: helix-turn-helix domain-containing protein, partial [Arenibacterium sp.]
GGKSKYAFSPAGHFTGDESLANLLKQVFPKPHPAWPLEKRADLSGMPPRTPPRRFKRDVDETPAHFVEKVRVDHARTLLQDNKPLKRVATESGFGDIQRMRRAFQRRFGVQLSEYRNMFA